MASPKIELPTSTELKDWETAQTFYALQGIDFIQYCADQENLNAWKMIAQLGWTPSLAWAKPEFSSDINKLKTAYAASLEDLLPTYLKELQAEVTYYLPSLVHSVVGSVRSYFTILEALPEKSRLKFLRNLTPALLEKHASWSAIADQRYYINTCSCIWNLCPSVNSRIKMQGDYAQESKDQSRRSTVGESIIFSSLWRYCPSATQIFKQTVSSMQAAPAVEQECPNITQSEYNNSLYPLCEIMRKYATSNPHPSTTVLINVLQRPFRELHTIFRTEENTSQVTWKYQGNQETSKDIDLQIESYYSLSPNTSPIKVTPYRAPKDAWWTYPNAYLLLDLPPKFSGTATTKAQAFTELQRYSELTDIYALFGALPVNKRTAVLAYLISEELKTSTILSELSVFTRHVLVPEQYAKEILSTKFLDNDPIWPHLKSVRALLVEQ